MKSDILKLLNQLYYEEFINFILIIFISNIINEILLRLHSNVFEIFQQHWDILQYSFLCLFLA